MNTSDGSEGGGRFLPPRTSCPTSLATYRALVALYTVQSVLLVTLLAFGVNLTQAAGLTVGLLGLDLLIAKSSITDLRSVLAAVARLTGHGGPDQFGGMGRLGRA